MNNKYSTSLLLVAVVIIWGMIAYKAMDLSHPTDKAESPIKMEKLEVPARRALTLNYRDPFLEENEIVMKDKPTAVVSVRHKDEPQPPSWKYKGIISSNGKSVALVTYCGETYLLGINEEFDGFKVEAISSNTIVVSQNKHQFKLEAK